MRRGSIYRGRRCAGGAGQGDDHALPAWHEVSQGSTIPSLLDQHFIDFDLAVAGPENSAQCSGASISSMRCVPQLLDVMICRPKASCMGR